MTSTRIATCNCGAVRLEASGEPQRTGLCHCLTCRKETGSPFMAFGVWRSSDVKITGNTSSWRQTTDARHFCPACGSRMFALTNGSDEIEIRVGAFDEAPGSISPAYELFVGRRETWLAPLPVPQYQANRA